MSKYIFTRGSFREVDDELMHWKYLKKKKLPNGKWRYYYDLDSLKKDVKSAFTSTAKKTTNVVVSGRNTIQRYTKNAAKTIKTVANKLSNDIKETVARAKKNAYKYIAKVPTDGDTYRYFYSEKAYRAYLKGKNAVDKVLEKNVNATPSDVTKMNAKNLVTNTIFGSFGKAIYNVVAPALTAIQVALTTPKTFSELKKIDTEQTSDECQKAVNPDYDATIYDRSMNCTFCSSAYDLRKRGYDVEANPISMCEAYTIDDICSWYDNPQRVSKSDIETTYRQRALTDPKDIVTKREMLVESLKNNGEGSRGHLVLYWGTGGAHDVIWEVENGEVVMRDCQTGEVNRTFSILSYAVDYEYIRTDNLEPTEEILRTVRNRKKR